MKHKEGCPCQCEEQINLNPLIERFKAVNPSYARLYKNTTERNALSRLVALHGEEKIAALVDKLPETNTQPFFPTITTPYQLEVKLGAWLAAWNREKSKGAKNEIAVI